MMIPKNMLIVGISVRPELQCENRLDGLEAIASLDVHAAAPTGAMAADLSYKVSGAISSSPGQHTVSKAT